MTDEANITQESLSQFLDYDPETGIFFWKERQNNHFKSIRSMKMWNKRYSKTVAGTVDTHGYIQIRINYKLYLAHKLAWLFCYGVYPNNQLDHINCNRKDNRINNLRLVTKFENAQNSKIRHNNKSGYKGVSWHQHVQKWTAQIQCNKKHIHLGYYATPEEAYAAYCKAAADLHGEYHRLA